MSHRNTRTHLGRVARGAALAAALVTTLAPRLAVADPPVAAPVPSLPDAPVRLWLKAPTAGGLWTMRLDNEGSKPVRVPADVRLLRFEVRTGDLRPKTVRCALPASLRPAAFPEKRALLLPPGQSYIESFDPHLFCFGKDAAALAGGMAVHTALGWEAPPAYARKPAEGPFVAAGTDFPPTVQALSQLGAPGVVLSYNAKDPDEVEPPPEPAPPPPAPPAAAPPVTAPAKDGPVPRGRSINRSTRVAAPFAPLPPSGGAPAPPASPASPPSPPAVPEEPPPPAVVDENAPRIELNAAPYSDAGSPDTASVTVTATNAGHRPMLVLLRPRMLSFLIEGPDGKVWCHAAPPTHAIPRDNFRTLKPGASVTMSVLLGEACPRNPFRRPGLYRVTPTLHAGESGAEAGLSAYTAVVAGQSSALVRVLTAPEPFYPAAPVAIPTPQPPAAEP